ncbi:MAG TPA: AMP-binding protein [Acidobacteriaceae bacterium]|nr:AMP-binding protein [Acidobacteriaceae bacterium]
MRPHLASLVDDFRRKGRQIAIVRYRGVRRFASTYDDVATLAGRFSAELGRRNIVPGDRVVLWGENSAEWVAAFFGCLLRGVLAVPLDAAGSPEFAARVIADISPKLILADGPRLLILPANVRQLSLDDLASLLPAEPIFTVDPAVTLDAPFQIIFTSGTTAAPKGIVHTNRNVLASLDPIEREMQKYLRYERIFHPLRFLHSLPLSHVFGQFMGLWTPVLLAAEVHFDTQLEPARLIDRLRLERISVLVAVPRTLELLRSHLLLLFPELSAQLAASEGWPIYKRFVRFRRIHGLTGWKFWALISGGATLPPELELFWGRLGYAVIQGYGMTETAALVTLNHPFHVGRGTLGKPLPGREVRISPEGEIMVRGDVVSGSTWASGGIQPRTSEWLATGDLATQDDSGELRFSGRRGDVIVTAAGLNIYPADLEAALLKQPGVRAAAVVGCEGANGPEPVAVLLADLGDAELREVLDQVNGSLADFQQIRRVLRWPEPSFPYTSTGKLLRRVVAEWATDQIAATAAHPSAGRGDVLLQMMASVTGEAPIADDNARLSEDLHLDSLGRVQLQSLLEQRFGLELADEQIAQVKTLGELRALTGAAAPGASGPQTIPATHASAAEPPTLATESAHAPMPVPAAPAHRYPRWPWSSAINALRVAFQELILRPLVWLIVAPRIEGSRPSAPTAQAPLLIIGNHVTAYDAVLILYGLPAHLRHRVAVAMSGEILMDYRRGRGALNALLNPLMPFAYWLITVLLNVFPLPRLGGFRRSFEHAGRALDRGYSVMIFPEGHRSADGTLQPFRSGIGLLAQQAEADVLPVALVGFDQVIQSGKRWIHAGRIAVRVGEPIPYDPRSTPEQTTQRLQAAMAKLLG